MEIKDYKIFRMDEILDLYRSVGWVNYLQRAELLPEAYRNSLCVLGAYDGDRLVGLLRAVGDGLTVVFIQDLLVLPDYQRQGIGTKLLKEVIKRYPDVYQMELLTDDRAETRAFYRAAGFAHAGELGCTAYLKL